MASVEEIREGIKRWGKEQGPPVTNIARVKSVDEGAQTCVLVDEDDQEIFDVRLRPVLSGNTGYTLVPKVGADVMAIRVEDDEDWMIIAADEIERVIWKTSEGVECELSDKAVIKKGSTRIELGTKVKIEAGGKNLGNALEALLNAIENMSFVVPGASNTTTLLNLSQFITVKNDLNQILE